MYLLEIWIVFFIFNGLRLLEVLIFFIRLLAMLSVFQIDEYLISFFHSSSSVLSLIQSAMSDPVKQNQTENEEEKISSRHTCSVNTLHQVDLILRKCVATFLCSSEFILLKTLHIKISVYSS